MATQITPTQTGITVSTPITAGGIQFDHAERVVVSTAITAGCTNCGIKLNHAEGIVGATADHRGWHPVQSLRAS